MPVPIKERRGRLEDIPMSTEPKCLFKGIANEIESENAASIE